MADGRSALVLGGGGVAGIAWETGVLAGLADGGVDVTGADLLVGTSAGSTVAAQVGSGLSLDELFARQADPAMQNEELAPTGLSVAELMEAWVRVFEESSGPEEARRRLGALALAAETVPERARRAVIEGRLPMHEWPVRELVVPAVNATTGEPRVFNAASGVSLVDAVAASCAVPGIWPPVTIEGVRYVDGGVRTANNLDLAAGYGRVLLLAPMDDPSLAAEIEAVTGAGGRVEVIAPDEVSLAAFGDDPLSPATRTPAARAGRAQGVESAARVKSLWA